MCATIANGGVRLQTHFLDKVTDYTGEEVIEEYEPVELYDAGISSDVLGVVQAGMQMVATQGTASGVLADYPVSIACKTGTAETSNDKNGTEDNLSFICYAPANDPEIAIAVMVEYGNKGSYAVNVAKDILDQYFGFYTWDEDGNKYDQSGNMVDDDGTIIKTAEELEELGLTPGGQDADKDQDDDTSSTVGEATATPSPTPTPTPDRGSDIPDAPYTGEETSSSSSSSTDQDEGETGGDEGAEAGASPDPGGLTGPYYRGG